MKQFLMLSPIIDIPNINPQLFARQWLELKSRLMDLGNDVVTIAGKHKFGRVDIASTGFIFRNFFISSSNRNTDIDEWFNDHQFSVRYPKFNNLFEGSKSLCLDNINHILWYGIGKGAFAFKRDLETLLEDTSVTVRGLELINSNFQSLDKCFNVLDTGYLLWYPEAFSSYSRSIIEGWFEDKNIKVSKEDALAFGCSAISKDSLMVMPKVSNRLIQQLIETKHTVMTLDMSEVIKAEMGCKSLVLEVIQ